MGSDSGPSFIKKAEASGCNEDKKTTKEEKPKQKRKKKKRMKRKIDERAKIFKLRDTLTGPGEQIEQVEPTWQELAEAAGLAARRPN